MTARPARAAYRGGRVDQILAQIGPWLGGGAFATIATALVGGLITLRGKRVDVVEAARADLADTSREMLTDLRGEIAGVREQWRADLARMQADLDRMRGQIDAEQQRREAAERERDDLRIVIAEIRTWIAAGMPPPPPAGLSSPRHASTGGGADGAQ